MLGIHSNYNSIQFQLDDKENSFILNLQTLSHHIRMSKVKYEEKLKIVL